MVGLRAWQVGKAVGKKGSMKCDDIVSFCIAEIGDLGTWMGMWYIHLE